MDALLNRNINNFSRIVIKIGSALLVDPERNLRKTWLNSLIDDISKLIEAGKEVLIVSSGAVALGRSQLGSFQKSEHLKLEESQAAAAIGQIELNRAYNESLNRHRLSCGQILLTLGDTETRRRYLNARATINTLIQSSVIPIINENDSVATAEIRYGDNDRLAARVASMVNADLLILLSDIDGLYSQPPTDNPNANLLEYVEVITAEIENMAGESTNQNSRGGMKTKIEAAKIATASGTTMVIGSGKPDNPITKIAEGARSTWFAPAQNPVNDRKKWIAGGLEVSGLIVVDSGAIVALKSDKSLLPAGVTQITGNFSRGDTVEIADLDGIRIGRGLIEYDSDDARKIAGLQTIEIQSVLRQPIRSTMIHRDNLVLTP
ncbi:glutamate 5-kinase [bacterium]|nr:glutamate 5-kinase [bacterium]MDB4458438.1 glutamate 5-kinase [bacterium]MDB4480926.1 glutamate 5-kinase [bacterium]